MHLRVKSKAPWTVDEIKLGVDHFRKEYARLPTAKDFDRVAYLPTAKTIQRRHGGLPAIRKLLGFDSILDYTKGHARSEQAKALYANASQYEENYYKFLLTVFPEINIHEQKRLRPGNVSCDFFIYTSPREGFAIDLFYAKDIYSAAQIINHKLRRYEKLPHKIYFVILGNNEIDQENLEKVLENRKTKIPKHIKILTEITFRKELKLIKTQNEPHQ